MPIKLGRATIIMPVASEAGVSTQTISHASYKRQDISPEPYQRVQSAIEKMRCQLGALAGSLLRQCSHTVSVLTAGGSLFGSFEAPNGIATAEKAVIEHILNTIESTWGNLAGQTESQRPPSSPSGMLGFGAEGMKEKEVKLIRLHIR